MCPSFFRIQLPLDEASVRFSKWIGFEPLGTPKKLKSINSVDAACKGGVWRSRVAVFVYQSGDWTVYEDLTGYLATYPAKKWKSLARRDELVFAGYNDSVPYGQLIVVLGGRIVREFLDNEQDPRNNVNRGKLNFEKKSPIRNWIEAASFVDEDDIYGACNVGLLWMFGKL